MLFEKITLEGESVRLEPISLKHKDGLCAAIQDGELWKLFVTTVPHPDNIDHFIARAEERFEQGEGLAFATIDKANGEIVGSTRFLRAQPEHKTAEIGFTFLAKRAQRTAINTESKLLLLQHAFEKLHLNRMEFITDFLNTPSRRALEGIGARQEGILRNHLVMEDGRVRDSVLFSIINNEWPGIKQHLQFKLMHRSEPTKQS